MSLEAAIKRARDLNLKVTNLFELDNGLWRANVGPRGKADLPADLARHPYEYGTAPDPEAALRAAIDQGVNRRHGAKIVRSTYDLAPDPDPVDEPQKAPVRRLEGLL